MPPLGLDPSRGGTSPYLEAADVAKLGKVDRIRRTSIPTLGAVHFREEPIIFSEPLPQPTAFLSPAPSSAFAAADYSRGIGEYMRHSYYVDCRVAEFPAFRPANYMVKLSELIKNLG